MVLVTGANGLVGSYLCRYLLQKGERVRALKRTNSNLRLVDDIKDRIEWIEGDILDVFSVEDAITGVDKIYHCAALISYTHKNSNKMMQVNVEGTANIVNTALDCNIKKLIYISSIAALGKTGKKNEVVNEQTPWDRKNLTSDYSISKFLGEREVWRGIAEGLNAVIVNPSIIVGAGNWDEGSCKLFQTVYNQFKYYTEGITGYVDVRDVVKIIYTLMENEISGERFILSSENVSYRDFLSSIANALHVKAPTIRAGKFLSGIAWRSEWLKSMITHIEPSVTKQTAVIANKKTFYDRSKITDQLNYQFIPVHDSIRDTAIAFNNELTTGNFSALTF